MEIIAIIQENIQLLPITYVIQNIVYLKKIPVAFHNGSNYDYHFIIKELAEQFKNQFTCLEENTENNELIKMESKLLKVYPTYYNLLIAQDLWQTHYKILLTIFLKEFIYGKLIIKSYQ